jgi:non-ribosomal peptide synthetase component E (peptide arylation enzyme)
MEPDLVDPTDPRAGWLSQSLFSVFEQAAARRLDAPAVYGEAGWQSYRAVLEQARAVGHALATAGLCAEPVVIFLPFVVCCASTR